MERRWLAINHALNGITVATNRQPENKNRLVLSQTVFILDSLNFRLPNHQIRLMLLPLPYVQPNGASFFRKQACACPTARKARLVRTRRKKDAQ